jgi:hypothetical protein
MTIEDVAKNLARSPMPEEEKALWLKLIPFVPKNILLEFGQMLEADINDVEKLKKKYLRAFKNLAEEQSVAEMKGEIDL